MQVRSHPVQEATLRVRDPPAEHEDRVQGQLQVRGPGEAVGRQLTLGRQTVGGRILASGQIFSHLISAFVSRLQHHLLAGIHTIKNS